MTAVSTYTEPQCPHCQLALTRDWIRTGAIVCPYCHRGFEATVFQPQTRRERVLEVAIAGPDGATACANHARNAAVTSCQRCGLLICSLCDMNLGEGSLCPSCFERIRSEGASRAVVTRERDNDGIARLCVIVGFLLSFTFLNIPIGALGAYAAYKSIGQRHKEGRPATGPYVMMTLAVLEVLAGFILLGFIIWSIFNTSK